MEIVDMITRRLEKFLNARVGVLQKKNLILTLPNGYRIELGNHRDFVEITFNSWLGIWLIFRRGSLGSTMDSLISSCWIYRKRKDFSRIVSRNIFYIHSAFGGANKRYSGFDGIPSSKLKRIVSNFRWNIFL